MHACPHLVWWCNPADDQPRAFLPPFFTESTWPISIVGKTAIDASKQSINQVNRELIFNSKKSRCRAGTTRLGQKANKLSFVAFLLIVLIWSSVALSQRNVVASSRQIKWGAVNYVNLSWHLSPLQSPICNYVYTPLPHPSGQGKEYIYIYIYSLGQAKAIRAINQFSEPHEFQ